MSDFSLNSLDRLALGQEAKGQAKSLGQLKPNTEEDPVSLDLGLLLG